MPLVVSTGKSEKGGGGGSEEEHKGWWQLAKPYVVLDTKTELLISITVKENRGHADLIVAWWA